VSRVDQHHLEPGVLEQVAERLPEVPVASITTHETCWATKCSRNARIWLVIDPQLVTVSCVRRLPDPATRTQTLAPFLANVDPRTPSMQYFHHDHPFR